jgi:hypothetical protein
LLGPHTLRAPLSRDVDAAGAGDLAEQAVDRQLEGFEFDRPFGGLQLASEPGILVLPRLDLVGEGCAALVDEGATELNLHDDGVALGGDCA